MTTILAVLLTVLACGFAGCVVGMLFDIEELVFGGMYFFLVGAGGLLIYGLVHLWIAALT